MQNEILKKGVSMNFLKVAKNDIKGLFKNRFLALATIVIMAIPVVYGGTYLASMWDPYGRTSELSIAVVNNDIGGVLDDTKVNYGQDIADNLKNNHDLGWKFLKTDKEAMDGLNGDKYYAVLIIPKDFSKKIIDVNNGIVQKPKIEFIQNKKRNYVVGVITDKAANAVKAQIIKSVSNKFSTKVFDSLFEVRDGMEAAYDGTSQLRDGIMGLKDQVPTMESGLNELYNGSSGLANKLNDAYDGSKKLRDGVGTIKDKMPDLADGVNKLYNGSSTLSKNMSDALDGSKKLRDGALQIKDMLPSVTSGVNDMHDGAVSLKEGIGEVNDKMPDLMKGVDDLTRGARVLDAGVASAQAGVNQLASAMPALKTGSDQLKLSVVSSINTSLNTVGADGKKPIDEINGSMYFMLYGLPTDNGKGGMTALDKYVTSGQLPISSSSITNWTTDYKTLQDFYNNFVIVKTSIDAGDTKDADALCNIGVVLNGTNIQNPSSQFAAISSNMAAMAQEIAKYPYFSSPAAAQLQYIYSKLTSTSPSSPGLAPAITMLDTSLNSLKQSLVLLQGLNQLSTGLDKTATGANQLASGFGDLRGGSLRLVLGMNELNNKTQGLQDGVGDLYSGSQDLTNGLDKFRNTVPTLTSGVSQLSDGTRDLSDGLFKLNTSTITLKDNIGKLNRNVPDLQQGANDLYDGVTDLSDGIATLHDGSKTLADGIKSLKDKMPDLADGVTTLYEGVAQLNDKMEDGAKKISDKLVAGNKIMGDFASDPVKVKNDPLFEVKQYGYGLAPNFMSLGLWVGALLMFFVLNDEVQEDMKVSAGSVVLGKYFTYALIGVAQAVSLSLFVLKLGLTPPNVKIYIVFNIFLSLVFIAIIQNLIFVMGDVGRVLAIVILILQLTSSGGTFPRELLPKFFRVINPVLPFTYSISAMREINSGIDFNVLNKDIRILSLYLILSLALTLLLKAQADKVKGGVSLEEQRAKMLNKVGFEGEN